ncbi:MAG: hypothetical protein ACU0CY_13845 [Maritimibacter harenae]|jgi:hypothetical protein|uniref:Uncharacterized protein n=1 Tax=Maritimibacter harenae TaxID=2606218 RepID=A0A845M997_9RHOB|nr:hypothetical protein [Maritimibacter harenae]MZR13001.1 hypothetical protein [Maritimibacter harenae]
MANTTASHTGDGTAPLVAQHATKAGELRLDQIQLIGIAGKPGEMTALFRMTKGDIMRVSEGDESPIGSIHEISDAGVVVTRSNGNSIFIPPIPVG